MIPGRLLCAALVRRCTPRMYVQYDTRRTEAGREWEWKGLIGAGEEWVVARYY